MGRGLDEMMGQEGGGLDRVKVGGADRQSVWVKGDAGMGGREGIHLELDWVGRMES